MKRLIAQILTATFALTCCSVAGAATPDPEDPNPPVLLGGASGIGPEYVVAMSPFEVKSLTAASENNTMEDAAIAAGFTDYDGSSQANDLAEIFAQFSGGVGVEAHGSLYVNGAGHPAAANGMFKYDFTGTTQPVGWTLLPNSMSPFSAAVVDVDYYSDGKPTAIHTYDGLVYDATSNKIYRISGPTYGGAGRGSEDNWFDLTSNQWSTVGQIPDGVGRIAQITVYDSVTRKIMQLGQGSATVQFYDISSNTWGSELSTSAWNTTDATLFYDPVRNFAYIMESSVAARFTIDWGTAGVDDASITTTTTYTPSDAGFWNSGPKAAFFDQHPSDSSLDRFWSIGGNPAGSGFTTIYEMNAVTYAVTAHTLTGDTIGGWPDGYVGSYERFMFHKGWGAIGYANASDNGAWIIKIPTWN